MSTIGSFNTKNPTIKRILKEASELANSPSADYHAVPLENNLFEWHFTLRGPPAPSPYANGIYHGRIVLPSAYPHRPPSFRFLTPSGRFEVNREICLSISGFHEETWQPAWGIRTALVAIRSFMDTGAAGQVGGLECDEESRKKLAAQSRAWRCAGCGSTNEDVIKEREKAVQESAGTEDAKEETVPEELRLAYREDLGAGQSKGKEKAVEPVAPAQTERATQQSTSASTAMSTAVSTATPVAGPQQRTVAQPTRTISAPVPVQQQPMPARQDNRGVPAWVDQAIYAIIAALAILILRRIL